MAMQHQCPDCQYRTTSSKRMDRHQKEHGHGGRRRQRAWKGHNKTSGGNGKKPNGKKGGK